MSTKVLSVFLQTNPHVTKSSLISTHIHSGKNSTVHIVPTDKSTSGDRFAQRHWGMSTWICTHRQKICAHFLKFGLYSLFIYIFRHLLSRQVQNFCCTWPSPFFNDLVFFRVLSDLLRLFLKHDYRTIPWENYISAASLPGSGEPVFKDKKTFEESEEGCVKTSCTPWGFKRGNSTVVCEAECEHPLVHLVLLCLYCMCVYVLVHM